MSSSSAILYPSLKRLEQSNSSFVKVSPSVNEMNSRNSTLNRNFMASKNERGNKSRSKPNEFAERKEEFSSNRRHQREYLSSDERRVARDKDIEEHNIQIEKSEPRDSETDDLKSKQQIEESERSEELRLSDEISAPEQAAEKSTESTELSLTKPEAFQSLISKHPQQHMIIFNNTFIRRPTTEQDDFLTKFPPTFYTKNANIKLLQDILPLVTEHIRNDDFQTFTEKRQDAIVDKNTPVDRQSKAESECENSDFVNERNHNSIPIGAIVTAILWIVLIFFWFLLYLKVLNVYNPLPKVIPTPEPTNYELCLRFFRRLGTIMGQWWKF